jgi:hypothetical protein
VLVADGGKIAYEVTERSQGIKETIDILAFQLGRIQLLDDLSSDTVSFSLHDIHFTAFKFATAIIRYLALALEHFKNSFGSSYPHSISNPAREHAQNCF